LPCSGKRYAIFSLLADKDILGSIQPIQDLIDQWYVAPLSIKRGASVEILKNAFQQAKIDKVNFFSSIETAYQIVKQVALPGDQIVIFGSFHTVASCHHF
jgi:dihydrofolate synthase/folylpolyglutamate synthase